MLKRFDEFGRDLSRGPVTRDTRAARLRCAACGTLLGRHPERVSKRGAHRHHCVNPHGFAFEIGCFRRLENLSGSGERTLQDTWFPGYAWRVVVCTQCANHVGWHFLGADDAFFGLILDRVRED